MSEEQFVTAVPVKPLQKSLRHWLALHMGMNFCTSLYIISTTEVSGYTFAYILWGVWLPCFGYVSATAGEIRSLGYFAFTQCIFSVIAICCVLSVASFYWTFQGMCEDCNYQFLNQSGTCYVTSINTGLVIKSSECLSMPPADSFYATIGYFGLIAIVGIITAHRASAVIDQKKVRVAISEEVPQYIVV